MLIKNNAAKGRGGSANADIANNGGRFFLGNAVIGE